ncbi:ABC transporter substrate-binding protein [Streptomyces sp. NPDC101160]|uniref:ABC transporter substrate-binding protein n=1 Tax=Streptomyces sp. NPDC101160 TaxID=3366118 RepID=UPI0037FD1724
MEELTATDPKQVGRYRILARLGAGGMGRVYLGRSTSGRMVAVKVVRAELAEDGEFRRRFAREVAAARRVTGFFTAAVVDADPEGDPAWLATAYVPGLPLDAAVHAHGAWPRRSLLYLGAGLVEALEAIHGTGLVHRDLKPSNVLLASDGPRVIDFGISLATETSALTQTGMVIGTPGYMSPEQVTGRQVGPASDVFSLGAVLAFAGTGTPPFGIGAPHSVNFRAVYEDPDLSGLPADSDFVARCLAKEPEQRPTVTELLTEFAHLLGETGQQTYGAGLPKETDWLPEQVAGALTGRNAAGAADAGAGHAGSADAGAGHAGSADARPDGRGADDARPDGRGADDVRRDGTGADSARRAGTGADSARRAGTGADSAGPADAGPHGTGADGAGTGDAGPAAARASATTPPDPRDALAQWPTAAAAPAAKTPAPEAPARQIPATPAPAAPAEIAPPVAPATPPPTATPAPAVVPVAPPMPEHAPPLPNGDPPLVSSAWSPASPATSTASATTGAGRTGRAKRRRIVAIAVAAALVAGGGVTTAILMNQGKKPGDENTAEGGGSNSSGSKGSASGFDAATGNVVNASAKKGGTLELSSAYDADSWDPGRSYYGWVWNFQRLYARTLLTYAAKPGAAGTELVPDLAEAPPEVSFDGRAYSIRLRSGLTFEDGTPITAQDVKYAIERSFAQDVLSGGPVDLRDALDQGQNYQGPFKDRSATGLRSVSTPDERTLVFRLAKPDSRFPYLLASGVTAPVPEAHDTGAQYAAKPVSSGPYRFASYTPGQSLVLVRNDKWDQATDPLRKALPDRIKLNITTDADSVSASLLDGRIDLDAQQAGLSTAATSRVLQDTRLKAHADAPFNGRLNLVALVSPTAPFDNAHCRKAVLYAADTTALQNARGGPNSGVPHGNLLPPTVPGADAYDPYGLTAGKPQPVKAREELANCGRPNGFTTKILVKSGRPQDMETAQALQSSLRSVGITVEIAQKPVTEFFDVAGSPSTTKNQGIGMVLTNWLADDPFGATFLQPLADSRRITPGGNSNLAQVNDREIDTLFDQAKAAADTGKANGIYRQINHKLTDGAYYLPVAAGKTLNYRGPRLTNVYVNQAYGMVDLQALGVTS